MEMYLLKSVACLGIFFAFYKIFLERENMHTIKRFYLLGTVLASFLIPLITFTQYIEAKTTYASIITSELITELPEAIEVAPNYWAAVLWSIYGLGVWFFSLKFGRNLYSMIQKIRRNPLFKNDNIFHVLLKTPTTPHTFFSYIFLNKRKFEAREIPEEVLLHEQAHAREFHSLDVILMELLQIVFWFNPFLYLFKHSIKLNHEFLADRAVLNEGVETANYQNILLAFSSNATAPELANSINYSFIKKRFTVMKTSTSKRTIWLRSLILLPLLAMLIYGFSATEVQLKDAAYDTIEKADLKATPQEVARYNTLAAKWNKDFAKDNTKRIIQLKELTVLETLYRKMSQDQKANAEPFPSCVPPPPRVPKNATENQIAAYELAIINYEEKYNQKVHEIKSEDNETVLVNFTVDEENKALKATPKQIKEYNKLAKKYNDMPQDNMRINGKELTRMRYLYDLMTLEQRKNAEPYPNIPPPPPPPNAPPVPGAIDAPPPIEVIKGVNDGDPNIPPPPPPPPAPEAPLDHIIHMAKKGATFYYEGKKISSDKAIDLIKKNKDLNIQSTGHNSKTPVVKISKEPIEYKKSKSIAFETGNTRSFQGEENLFYMKIDDWITYFNQDGVAVDIEGNPVPEQKKSPFVYNGQRISPQKANQLLQDNKTLTPAAQKSKDGQYTIVLNTLTNNTSQNSYNNINNNINKNNIGNHNPNSSIGITEALKREATFYYNDKLISTKEAMELIQNPTAIARVQTVESKNGKPLVYLFDTLTSAAASNLNSKTSGLK